MKYHLADNSICVIVDVKADDYFIIELVNGTILKVTGDINEMLEYFSEDTDE